jgi:hypothetical protein
MGENTVLLNIYQSKNDRGAKKRLSKFLSLFSAIPSVLGLDFKMGLFSPIRYPEDVRHTVGVYKVNVSS